MQVDSGESKRRGPRSLNRSWGPSVSESSREGKRGAGWASDQELGSWYTDMPKPPPPRMSWLNPRALLHARNEFVATIADPVAELRACWMADMAPEQLTLDLGSDEFSFLVIGDTGEGDCSQWAVVPPLRSHAADARFMVICSDDVLYPVGDINDYESKFFNPYSTVPVPIYALPGNHDWYDSLGAFMFYFCDRDDPPPALPIDPASGRLAMRLRIGSRSWLRRQLWREPSEASDLSRFSELRSSRNHIRPQVPNPARTSRWRRSMCGLCASTPGSSVRWTNIRAAGCWMSRGGQAQDLADRKPADRQRPHLSMCN
jgi:hypothetical protein